MKLIINNSPKKQNPKKNLETALSHKSQDNNTSLRLTVSDKNTENTSHPNNLFHIRCRGNKGDCYITDEGEKLYLISFPDYTIEENENNQISFPSNKELDEIQKSEVEAMNLYLELLKKEDDLL